MAGAYSSGDKHRTRIAVSITLVTGAVLNGHILAGMSGKLRDTVNGPTDFLEFEGRTGNVMFIAKSALQSVSAIDTPRTDQMSRQISGDASLDPYAALGVTATAAPEEIKAAYWKKARAYHPDKLAGQDMPPEVADYMKAMFITITRAYEELTAQKAEV